MRMVWIAAVAEEVCGEEILAVEAIVALVGSRLVRLDAAIVDPVPTNRSMFPAVAMNLSNWKLDGDILAAMSPSIWSI